MKMEEDKSEEKSVKKEKKLKKGQASLSKNKNCAVVDGRLAEVNKEKKKGKKVDAVVIEVDTWDGGSEKEEKKKKKKKRKIITESLNDANGSDVKDGNDKEVSKKKKKKQLADSENQLESVQSSEKVEKKEKKVKNKNVQIKPENENVKTEKEQGEQQAGGDKLPKKAKKRKNSILVASSEETEEQVKKKKSTDEETTEAMDGINVTKQKNKAKTKVADDAVKLETPEGEMGEVEEVRVKKKKKKEDGSEVAMTQIKRKKKRSKVEKDDMLDNKEDKSTKSEIIIIKEGKTEVKQDRKKEKGRKGSVEVSEVDETEPKKKKRKKGNSKGEEEEPLLKCEEVEEQSRETVTVAEDTTSKKSKRERISNKVETQDENVSFETGEKKKKKKKIKEEVEDQHSPLVDVVFLSEKSGNTDEVTINHERRQALQMEIDQASQPQKPAKPTGFGQWSTAQFDSSDQQQKFLRLMGGFKKGFQPAAWSTGGANMALGKDAQQQLQQGLLGEFERAQSRRVDFSNRGAGLGFTAPSNKKFSIDINACRSVRFDD